PPAGTAAEDGELTCALPVPLGKKWPQKTQKDTKSKERESVLGAPSLCFPFSCRFCVFCGHSSLIPLVHHAAGLESTHRHSRARVSNLDLSGWLSRKVRPTLVFRTLLPARASNSREGLADHLHIYPFREVRQSRAELRPYCGVRR